MFSLPVGPIVTSEKARAGELDISLLERLFERPIYADHPQARSKMQSVTLHLQSSRFVPFTNLVKVCTCYHLSKCSTLTADVENYRSHPAILMPPSAIFYEDSLEPCAINGIISWSKTPDSQLPLMFIGHEHKDETADEVRSCDSPSEIGSYN